MAPKSIPLIWTVAALVLLIAESLVVATLVSPVHWLRTVLLFLVLAYTIFSRLRNAGEDHAAELLPPSDGPDPALPTDPRRGLIADP